MARARSRTSSDIWPGFVDALSTLLLVIIFLLFVFVLAQFFLTQALSGRDEALLRLQSQVQELADLLSLERQANEELRLDVAQLSATLQDSTAQRDELVLQLRAMEERAIAAEQAIEDNRQAVEADRETITAQLAEIESLKRDIVALREVREELERDVGRLAAELEERDQRLGALRDRQAALEAELAGERERTQLSQKELEEREIRLAEVQALYLQSQQSLESETAKKTAVEQQLAVLNQQIAALREQLARVEAALDAAEAKDRENKVVIADLGRRLNLALASKVEELSRYRSEFFGRLREVLADREGIRIVGDRFVFQSEVLFPSGSAELQAAGENQLATLAATLLEIAQRIPDDINWVLRVDGHTDRRPISTDRFPSNWELSSARAISVVKFLINNGVPADRLIAAGFGQFHPIDASNDEIAYRRNRRIEFKLTQR